MPAQHVHVHSFPSLQHQLAASANDAVQTVQLSCSSTKQAGHSCWPTHHYASLLSVDRKERDGGYAHVNHGLKLQPCCTESRQVSHVLVQA